MVSLHNCGHLHVKAWHKIKEMNKLFMEMWYSVVKLKDCVSSTFSSCAQIHVPLNGSNSMWCDALQEKQGVAQPVYLCMWSHIRVQCTVGGLSGMSGGAIFKLLYEEKKN